MSFAPDPKKKLPPAHWPADGSLPEHVTEFVEWLVDPYRQPKTYSEYEQERGLPRSTTLRWRKDKRVQEAIQKRSGELNINPERLQDVINAIFRVASEGDIPAAKLYLEYTQKLAPKRVIVEDRRIEELSPQELQHELEALMREDAE